MISHLTLLIVDESHREGSKPEFEPTDVGKDGAQVGPRALRRLLQEDLQK